MPTTVSIKIENMKYLLFLYGVICFLPCWLMCVFHFIMEDANTKWDEDGIHFSPIGYYHYKRKKYWEDKMQNCI